jgi:hypothetical protein
VSIDIEKKLYLQAKLLGITIITITLKPALAQFHDFEFYFDGNGSYEIRNIK